MIKFNKAVFTSLAIIITTTYIIFKETNEGITIRHQARTCQTIIILHDYLNSFYKTNGNFPTTNEGLQALVINPDSNKYPKHQKILKMVPTDTWGRTILYSSNTKNSFNLYSYGSDGKINGENLATDLNIKICKEKLEKQ